MKSKVVIFLLSFLLFFFTSVNFAQNAVAPTIGTTTNFVMFTSNGNCTSAGTTSLYRGSVGTNSGINLGFETLLLQPTHLYATSSETAQCTSDLMALYSELIARTPTKPETLGTYGTQTLTPGVYHSATAASVNGILTLDGQGNPNARFIIKTDGAFTIGAGSKILLSNGTQSKNVFWVINTTAAIAANTEVSGIFICNDGAISLGASCKLNGAVFTKNGAITCLDGMVVTAPLFAPISLISNQTIAYGTTPENLLLTGCTVPVVKWQSALNVAFSNPTDIAHFSTTLSGYCMGNLTKTTYFRAVINYNGTILYSNAITITVAPSLDASLGVLESFVLFTGSGAIITGASSTYNGNIGTNSGDISGFTNLSDASFHTNDSWTAACLNNMPGLTNAIEAVPTTNSSHSETFGSGEILVSGVYQLATTATVNGVLTLDGQNNPDAIFVFKIPAHLSFAAGTEIKLINGAKAANLFWNIGVGVSAGASCKLEGTFICQYGAITLGASCILNGRMVTNFGEILTGASCELHFINSMQLSASQTVALGTLPSDLVLSGNTSPVLKWQSSLDESFTNPVDILHFSPTLSGNYIGALSNTTYFRAVTNPYGEVIYSNTVRILVGDVSQFILFTALGAFANVGTTTFTSAVGTNLGAVSGFNLSNPLVHHADALTASFANSLQPLYHSLIAIPTTIASHAAFYGGGETIVPGVYENPAAVTMGGRLTFDAQNNPNAIFIIKIGAACAMAAGTEMILINGANANNVFFAIGGATAVGANSKLKGTFICEIGAISLAANCLVHGKILAIYGAIAVDSATLNGPNALEVSPANATSNQVIISGTRPAALHVLGTTGTILRWELSSSPLFTNALAIVTNETTLTSEAIGILTTTTYFRAVYTSGSTNANSNCVQITVVENSHSGILSSSQLIAIGSVPESLILSGNNGAVTQWQKASDSAFTLPIVLNNNTNLLSSSKIGALNATTYFRAVVQNDTAPVSYSNYVTLAVSAAAGFGTLSENQSYCIPTQPENITVSDYNASIIKWQKSSTSNFSTPIDIYSFNEVLTGSEIGVVSETTYYRVVFQKCNSPITFSAVTKIAITGLVLPNAGTLSSSQSYCLPTSAPDLILQGSIGLISKWQSSNSADFSTLNVISNTTATLNLGVVSQTTYYRAVVESCKATAYSTPVVVAITGLVLPNAGILSSNQSYCVPSTASNLVLSGSIGLITKWQRSNSVDFTISNDILNTTTTLNPGVVFETTYYRAVIESCNAIVYSTPVVISISGLVLPNAGIVSSNQSYCIPSQASNLELSNSIGLISKWQSSNSVDFTTFRVISNTTSILNLGVVSQTTYYRAVLESCQATAYSTPVVISISGLVLPNAGILSSNQSFCVPSTASNLVLSGSIGLITKWQSSNSVDFTTSNDILNTATTLNPGVVFQTTYYRAVLESCNAIVYSIPAVVFITGQTLVAGMLSSNQNFCSPSTPQNLTLAGFSGTITKWQSSNSADFSTQIDITNTTPTLQLGTVSQTTYYRVQVQNCGATAYSASVVITIAPISTWNGTSWDNGIPSLSNAILITGDYTVNQNIESCSMTVNNGAHVLVNSDVNVTLNGALTVASSSSFTLNNNSNLLQTSVAANIGNITVKRESAPLYRLDSTLWSAPVTGQNLRNFSSETLLNRFYFYDSGSANNGNYAAVFNNPSFPGPSVSSYNFETAKGYLLRAPNTFASYIPAVAPATTSAFPGIKFQGEFNGNPNNGTITSLLDPVNFGFNLIGNPYPSGINANSFFAANQNTIEGTIWLWRKIYDLGTTIGYATMTNLGVVSLQRGVEEITSNGTIRTGQGFFVKVKPTAAALPSVVFNNEMRSGDLSNAFFRNPNFEIHRVWFNLSNSSGVVAQILVGYMTGATNGFDYGIEGQSFSDTAVNLRSIVADNYYAIQGRALPFSTNDEVPLNFKTDVAGTFTIGIDHFDGLFLGNQPVYIKDNLNGNIHNLKDSSYTFASEIGNFDTRFTIVYQEALTTNTSQLNSNTVVVYKQNESLFINSGNRTMSKIEIYDLSGRLIFVKENINAATTTVSNLAIANQVVVVKIITASGTVVKKITY